MAMSGMDMSGMSMTMTSTAASATATAMSNSTSGSSMASSMGSSGCKISMLWNWNTIDACFISPSWQIKSNGMFAGSCIGVILLVMALEFLRRSVKEFDRYLIRQHQAKFANNVNQVAGNNNVESTTSNTLVAAEGSCCAVPISNLNARKASMTSEPSYAPVENDGAKESRTNSVAQPGPAAPVCTVVPPFRPSVAQQALRALLHMVQFAVAYFVMLLAMYYNGYLLICIFIGAYLGAFIFQWEILSDGPGGTSAAKEATVCCG